MSARAPVEPAAGGFYVTIATPKGSTTKKIEGDQLTVGRAEDCNLTIQHETLSRRHMTVQLKAGQCFVEDHGSSNGTFVNGKKIKPHFSTRVLPEDFIQLGQSGVRLSVSVEPQMWKSDSPPLPSDVKPMEAVATAVKEENNTIVTTTQAERKLSRTQPNLEIRNLTPPDNQAEKLIQEAQKKAAALIQEAELDAERRVEDIYRRAHETQAKSDEVYQKRLNEAYRSAEGVYQKSQAESALILDQARLKSAEIRAQAEGFVMELRRRTEEDCERILDEAQVTARELKESRLAEADEMIAKREEELVRNARDTMNTRMARFEEDLLKEAARQREALEAELHERKLQLDLDSKEQIETTQALKKEISHLIENRDREAKKLRELQEDNGQKSAVALELKQQVEIGKKSIQDNEKALAALQAEIERYAKIKEEARVAAEKVKISQSDVESQLLSIRSQFEETKVKMQKDEQKHFEEMKLDTTRRIAALEKSLMEELVVKKERLAREIGLMLESHLKQHPEVNGKNMRSFQDHVAKLMDSEISTLSKDSGAKEKQKSLIELKSREKWKATFLGLLLGAVGCFGGQKAYHRIKAETSPIQRKVLAAQDERKADLERRKFAPAQTKEIRETYMDSVLYTENFVQKYQNEEFQRKLLAAATPFLLKTWRVEEDKVIQLLATTNSMVKTLGDRRDAIHPDFVPQGLEKMREVESEAMTRIRTLLGSQVRVDSYKKFERKFYEENAN